MKKTQEVRHTLGLAMIMKDEVDDLNRIVKGYGSFFDKIYVTVTHEKTYESLRNHFAHNPLTSDLVELSYFKWIDHFGKARRYNQKQVKTDYWMWMDTDDEIEGAENLRAVVDHMVINKLDTVQFKCDYFRRVSLSDTEQVIWRERIIKTASRLVWNDNTVHEFIDIDEGIKQELLSDVVIKHRKTAEQLRTSRERDKSILEKEWQRSKQASTAWYLGVTRRALGDYEGAIEILLFAADHSTSKSHQFTAWQNLSECYYQTGQLRAALDAISECMAIDSEHPEPWYQAFAVFRAMGHHDLAVQSAETAMSKAVAEEQAIVLGYDPSLHQYRAPFSVAQYYLSIGNVERAYQLYQKVKKIAPGYIEELSIVTDTRWSDIFEQFYDDFKNNPR